MAAQGQSAFMTSGDEAAYDDYDEPGTSAAERRQPRDSPYVTTSGGTTLPFSGTVTGPDGTAPLVVPLSASGVGTTPGHRRAQVQGEPLKKIATDPANGVVGSGGGFSLFEGQPPYQQGVAGTSSVHRRAVSSRRPRSRTWAGSRRRRSLELQPHPANDPAPARLARCRTCRPTPTPTAAICSTTPSFKAIDGPCSRAAGAARASSPRSSTARRR